MGHRRHGPGNGCHVRHRNAHSVVESRSSRRIGWQAFLRGRRRDQRSRDLGHGRHRRRNANGEGPESRQRAGCGPDPRSDRGRSGVPRLHLHHRLGTLLHRRHPGGDRSAQGHRRGKFRQWRRSDHHGGREDVLPRVRRSVLQSSHAGQNRIRVVRHRRNTRGHVATHRRDPEQSEQHLLVVLHSSRDQDPRQRCGGPVQHGVGRRVVPLQWNSGRNGEPRSRHERHGQRVVRDGDGRTCVLLGRKFCDRSRAVVHRRKSRGNRFHGRPEPGDPVVGGHRVRDVRITESGDLPSERRHPW